MSTAVRTQRRSGHWVLNGVDWSTYSDFLRAFRRRPGTRLTYDQGKLEIMTLSFGHEQSSRMLGRFVVVLTEELGMPLCSGGSTTLRKRKKRKGLEPDDCFWIHHESQVRGKQRINLRIDPPPDLAIEVDVSRTSVPRIPVYADMNVPELWRLQDWQVHILLRQINGEYLDSPASALFPFVKPADLQRFVDLRGQKDENAIVAAFRQWVRQQIAKKSP